MPKHTHLKVPKTTAASNFLEPGTNIPTEEREAGKTKTASGLFDQNGAGTPSHTSSHQAFVSHTHERPTTISVSYSQPLHFPFDNAHRTRTPPSSIVPFHIQDTHTRIPSLPRDLKTDQRRRAQQQCCGRSWPNPLCCVEGAKGRFGRSESMWQLECQQCRG